VNETTLSPLRRFLATLDIVHREARHLAWSHRRVFAQRIDLEWFDSLDRNPERAEQLAERPPARSNRSIARKGSVSSKASTAGWRLGNCETASSMNI